MAQAPAFRKALFEWSMRLARRNVAFACNGSRREGLFDLLYRVADSLVYSRLREAFGLDRLRCAISGGGPLSTANAEFFLGIGVTLLEGFGMTETSPVTNVNRPGMIKPGSVGPAFEDTQVRISDEGELLVRGPQVMMGYYRNRVATRHAFTRDGFFKSGDLAAMDEQGRVTIMGRLKDIIITSGGKNIAPQMIESRVRQSKFVSQVALVGDRRKYVTALIIPDFAQLGRWAKARRIEYSSNKELISDERTINMISAEIEKLTRDLSQVERIKRFRLIDDVWSQESGDLTPTMKVKRRVIERKYAREIASMYPVEIN
jgi:long-chain acyl-CoA synthetase